MIGKVLSIEVGSMFTKVCEVSTRNKKYVIGKSFIIETPPNTYDDGYIQDDEALCDQLFHELNRQQIYKRRAVFTISSSRIINREVVLPHVAKNKIMYMVQANITEYFPVDLAQYKVTYKVLEYLTEDKVKKMKLLLIAVPLDLLETYYQLAKDIGMAVDGIDYSGNSIYQLVKDVDRESTMMSIHIGETSTMVSIVNKGVLDLQRQIPYGVNIILEMIRNQQSFSQRETTIQILQRLQEEQLINAVLPETEGGDEDTEMDDAARQRQEYTENFRALIDRIGRIAHYYTTTKQGVTVDKMFISGVGATLKGVPQLLEFELGVSVVSISALRTVRYDAKLLKREDFRSVAMADLAMSIGAVIQPMDLLSALLQNTKKKRMSLTTAILCAVIGVATAASMAAYANFMLLSAQQTKERLQNRIEELKGIDEVLQTHDDLLLVYNSTLQMYDFTRNPNEGLVEFIEELEEKMPSSIQVLNANVSATGITMNVEVADWIAAADTIVQLKKFESIANVSVSAVSEQERENTVIVNKYYVDGVPVDSPEDIPETNADGEYPVITVEQTEQKETEKYCSFSVNCTYSSLPASLDKAPIGPASSLQSSEAASEEGGSEE